jgi:transposase-like protein
LVECSGDAATKTARRYGVSEKTLYAWRDEFIEGGKEQLKNKAGQNGDEQRKIKQLERRLEKRDQVIGELTIANRVLKKISDESGLPPSSEDV